ncbi:hypothetical protein MASR2M36_30430 [Providencia sp.]
MNLEYKLMIYSIGKRKSTSHFLKIMTRKSEAHHNNHTLKKEDIDDTITIFVLGVCPKKRSITA